MIDHKSITLGFVIPGSIEAPTGGTRYDRDVITRLPLFGINPLILTLSNQYPFPYQDDRITTARILETAECACFLIDGLAFGAFDETELKAIKKPLLVLLHHPLADETGLSPETIEILKEREKTNLAFAHAVIVTSQATANRVMSHYDVQLSRLHIAEPGVHHVLKGFTKSEHDPKCTIKLLAVGSIIPRKNYHLIIDALSQIDAPAKWSLHIVGQKSDPSYQEALEALASHHNLKDQIIWEGAVSENRLQYLYQTSNFMLYPSLYEGYGMALTEALAYGLPVLTSETVPATLPFSGPAVIKLDPSRPKLWTDAINQWMNDTAAFTNARKAAKQAALSLPTWEQTTDCIARVVKTIANS